MKQNKSTTIKATDKDKRKAMASPLRLEILGLFTTGNPLAISDMATLMGRAAGSLYHHVGILEKSGLLKRSGTRPGGKRHEALFLPMATRIELATTNEDGTAATHLVKTLTSAFRMAERDFGAALESDESSTEGPGRNLYVTRMHLRATPKILAGINKHLKAIEDLLAKEASQAQKPSSGDQHISLTVALLPLKGRNKGSNSKGG